MAVKGVGSLRSALGSSLFIWKPVCVGSLYQALFPLLPWASILQTKWEADVLWVCKCLCMFVCLARRKHRDRTVGQVMGTDVPGTVSFSGNHHSCHYEMCNYVIFAMSIFRCFSRLCACDAGPPSRWNPSLIAWAMAQPMTDFSNMGREALVKNYVCLLSGSPKGRKYIVVVILRLYNFPSLISEMSGCPELTWVCILLMQ